VFAISRARTRTNHEDDQEVPASFPLIVPISSTSAAENDNEHEREYDWGERGIPQRKEGRFRNKPTTFN
jgi:hypothetical protein